MAKATATLDRATISLDESFTLTIQADSTSASTPDLSVLPDAVSIINQSTSSQSSYVNGQFNESKTWTIQLMPQKKGQFTIPAITLGNETTQPISFTIQAAKPLNLKKGELPDFFIESDVDNTQIYVQAQLVYTLKIYTSIQLQSASLSELVIEDASILPIGRDVQYQKNIQGKNFVITERRYAIFPEKSGELVIPKQILSADILQATGQRPYFGRLLGPTKTIRRSTKPHKINVKSFPQGHQGEWIPTPSLTIQEGLTKKSEFIVGEPITWTLQITAEGLSENQLPEIKLPNVKGMKWYPDNAEKERKDSIDSIIGVRTERFAIVPTITGELTIPAVSIRWFNTTTERYETTQVPSQTLQVIPDPNTSIPQNTSSTGTTNTGTENSDSNLSNTSLFNTSFQLIVWQTLSLFFALLWLTTLFFFFKKRQQTSLPVDQHNKTPDYSNDFKHRIKKACDTAQPFAIYSALLNWFHHISSQRTISQQTTPQQITSQQTKSAYSDYLQQIKNPKIQSSLHHLETTLFSHDSQQSAWQDSQQLINWLVEIEKDLNHHQTPHQQEPIPPLYPQSRPTKKA